MLYRFLDGRHVIKLHRKFYMCLCSHLTALGVHHTTRCDGDESIDEDIAALVDALPQLLALDPWHRAVLASDTGLPCIQVTQKVLWCVV